MGLPDARFPRCSRTAAPLPPAPAPPSPLQRVCSARGFHTRVLVLVTHRLKVPGVVSGNFFRRELP